ncbi:ABC transporter permease [Saliterribacillus persicus]|uniref:ABC-2 type transport system permease protein n=1 Tax=Saliterribacillus persicus TaxID=930114 RepID=A0A368X4K7_9BACI|nr:ABC transporter permease [Saliterribacillus persicus]RCW62735.1 ABC-2 type transport system permease protein [Saliterribacillus persicus]
MNRQLFAQLGTIIKFQIRQNRWRFMIWGISLIFVTVLIASAFTGLYQTDLERQAIAETMENPAMTAMVGPGYGIDNYNNGAMMAHQMLLFTAIVFGIMSILLTSRHTRAEEEDGQIELVRALPVGRLTNLTATIIVLTGFNFLIGLVSGFSLFALQLEDIGLEGSLLYGFSLSAIGIFFVLFTAVFAQLSESSRGTVGFSIGFLLLFYLMRAIGDVSSEALALASPLGLVLRTEVYVNNIWWPLFVLLIQFILLFFFAFYLNKIRDVGAGFLPSKAGKRNATKSLLSPIGLNIRLQRTGIIAWAFAMFVLGISYGSVFGDLESFFANNDMLEQMLSSNTAYSLTEQFLTMLMVILAILSTIPTLILLMRMKKEEKKGRTEHLISRSVSKYRLLFSYTVLAFVSSIVMLGLAILGIWLASASVMEEPVAAGTFFEAGFIYLPAIWAMIGIGITLLGIFPRATSLIWLYVIYSFFTVYLGGLLDLPQWLLNLSVYGHIPQLPVENVEWFPLIVLVLITFALSIVGFTGFRKRDTLV